MNLFAVGEENAAALGVDTEKWKRIVFLAASLSTGAAVAFAGIIGFVGLLVPHAVRAVTGNDQRRLLPLAALSEPRFSSAADAVSRAAFGAGGAADVAVTAASELAFRLAPLASRDAAARSPCLVARYGRPVALNGLDADFYAGMSLCILGENWS